MTARHLSAFFYSDLSEAVYKCNKCSTNRKQAPGSDYSNLLGYLTAKHIAHAAEFEEFQRRHTPTMDSFGFVDERILHLFKLMDWTTATPTLQGGERDDSCHGLCRAIDAQEVHAAYGPNIGHHRR